MVPEKIGPQENREGQQVNGDAGGHGDKGKATGAYRAPHGRADLESAREQGSHCESSLARSQHQSRRFQSGTRRVPCPTDTRRYRRDSEGHWHDRETGRILYCFRLEVANLSESSGLRKQGEG